MSARLRSVSAVIGLVNAPPAFRIDVVGPDPLPVLLLWPSAGWARYSAGLLLLESESSEQLPSIALRWPHSDSLGPGRATTWQAVRRRVALRSGIAGVEFSADGCLPLGGRARSESVCASCAMVGWALSIGLIDLPFFSHWTHVTFKHLLAGWPRDPQVDRGPRAGRRSCVTRTRPRTRIHLGTSEPTIL
jgi:hypothetical protein